MDFNIANSIEHLSVSESVLYTSPKNSNFNRETYEYPMDLGVPFSFSSTLSFFVCLGLGEN